MMYAAIENHLVHHASFKMGMYIKTRIECDVFNDAQTGNMTDPNQIIRTAIRSYLLKHPEEYDSVFQDMFSEEEIKNMSMSLRGAA